MKEMLGETEANQIITELYDKGHGLATLVIEQVLTTQVNKDEREDLIQEGFLRLIIHVEKLRDKCLEERLSYMVAAMRCVAVDEGRRRSKCKIFKSLDDNDDYLEIPSGELTPEERYMMEQDIAEEKRHLMAAMKRLSDREVSLLVEKYKNGRSDAEIGRLLGIKTTNVRVYLARARKKVAIFYGEEANEEQRSKQSKVKPDKQCGSQEIRGVSGQGSPVL